MATVKLRLVLCTIFAIATLSLADEPVYAWTASRGAPTPESALAAVAQQPANGRVVVTMAVEGIRVPAVSVVLRSVDRNVVIAQTSSDALGQVSFPDISPGRYLVHTSRDGFAETDSPPFSLQSGETEQVLVEMRLTFVRESVDVIVPANSPTESLQPVAVSDTEAFVYLLRCRDGTLYCGWTNDLERRLRAHSAGTASRYTRARRPVKLAWSVNGNEGVFHVDATEGTGGQDNTSSLALRNLDFTSINFHDYLVIGTNTIEVEISAANGKAASYTLFAAAIGQA